MLTHEDFAAIIADISIGNLEILLKYDDDRPYLQIRCQNGTDTKTGQPTSWTSRKWMLSPHMVKSEVVRTAYKAYITAVLHEADEVFQYRAVSIYSPHANVDVLADVLGKNVYVDTVGDELSPEDARVNGMSGV
jgi:hypothetical protein